MISTTSEAPKNNTETILLKVPQLIPQNLVRVVKKNQAYRKGGIRNQHEEINGKHIFHSYGYGSSGIGLAYGSIFNSVQTINTYVSIDNPRICAVIGSGLIAMWTAVQLARIGCFVTVYAQKFGKYGDTKKQTDFDIEQGLWLPYGYDIADNLLHEVFTKTSYDYYRDCMKTKRYQGFKMTTIYEKDQTVQQLKKVIPSFIYNGYRPVNIDFGNGNTQKYTRLRVMRIDSQFFMEQLRTQGFLRGIKYVQRTFNTLDQVLSVPQQIIYNCSDNASKKLFNDQNVITYVDNLVIFKNPSGLDYAVSAKLKDNLHMRISSVGDKIILRSQSTEDNSKEDLVPKLIQQANNFFANRSNKAKL